MKQENEVIGIHLGYKRTDVGVIPQDWQVVTIGQLANVFRGASPRPIDSPVWFDSQSRTGWLRISDVTASGKFLDDTTQNLSVAGIENSRFVKSGNLVMSICATVGRPIITRKDVCIHDGFVVFRNLQADKEYLYYCLSNMETGWSKHGQTGSQMNLNTDLIDSTTIPLPPPAEQRAIAEALSDVDELLGSLERLIAKKRAIKQAAMQQLLTGKTRLPGFGGEWEMKQLRDIAELHRQNVVPAAFGDMLFMHFSLPAYDEGRCPVIQPGHRIGSIKFHVPDNAVLVSKLNPRIPRVWAPEPIGPTSAASTEFLVLTPKDSVSRGFLYVLCSSPGFCEQMELLATGTTGSHQRIGSPEAMKIKVWLPTNADEQAAIAAVLSDMDAEIAALERRWGKTSAIKQGMMQQLLTGRVRLVKSE